MADVIPQRMTAEIKGDFVVFLIGMRVNKLWKVHKWLPVFLAMPRMLKELEGHPESGFLGFNNHFGLIVQYWRSFDHLEAYARSHDLAHWPAWVSFNRRVGKSRGDVGIWHETYLVRAGDYECVYSGMPPIGLGKAAELMTASGRRESARGRVGARGAGASGASGAPGVVAGGDGKA
ncbi:MAG TPA: DUF4188 domain-containing protein [Longimicrobiales bacterium]